MMCVDETDPDSWVRIGSAMLRYYMHLDPDRLSDEQWAARLNDLHYLRKEEAKANNT